jgi:hypothetical protein
MADYTNTKTLNAFLAKPEDWNNWNHEFELQVETFSLEPHITNKKPLLPQPEMPDIRKKKYIKKPHAQRHARSQTVDNEEEDEETIQEKNNGQWMMTDLTDSGLKAFNLDLTWYKQLETSYEKQRQCVEKLTKWILQTVSPDYKSTCCIAKTPLWEWHQNLKSRCGLSTTDEKMQLKIAYKNALRPPRNIKDAYTWIDTWESIMARGLQKGLSDAKDTASWVPDLLQAVQGLMPFWATSFRQFKQEAIADGSLTFREVGNDFRKELTAQNPQKNARVTKGAFATTYDGDKDHSSEYGDAHTAEDHIPPRRGATVSRGNRISSGTKRVPSREENSDGGCPACKMPHALAECYYIFPEKAYPKWTPRERVKERVREALENNADLQAQVRALKGPRSKSKSKTPRPAKEEVVEEVED